MIKICLSMLVMTVVTMAGKSQQKPEPPPRKVEVQVDSTAMKGKDKLPQIDLPEFVITGKETPDLPAFQKFSADGPEGLDATFRKEQPGQREHAELDLGERAKPQNEFSISGDEFSGSATVGYGSYRTPFFDGWFGKNSGQSDFLLKAGYKSSNGYGPNTDYRSGHAGLSGGIYLPKDTGVLSESRIQAKAGFQGETYHLFGSAVPARARSVNRFTAEASAHTRAASPLDFSAGVHIKSAAIHDSLRTGETEAGLELSAARTLDGFQLRAGAGAWHDFYDAPSRQQNPLTAHFDLSVQYRIDNVVDITGGGMLSYVRGSVGAGRGITYPHLSVAWYTTPWLTLTARYRPYVQRNSLSSIVQENPYVVNDMVIRHTEFSDAFGLEAQFEITREFRAKISGRYQRARFYPLHVDSASLGLWNLAYFGSTRILSGEMELYAEVTQEDLAGMKVSVRTSENSATHKRVPDFPEVTFSALYQHRFPFRLMLGATMQFVDSRFADLANTTTVPSFFLLGFRAEYAIIQPLTIGLTMENILNQNQTWWRGYRGSPREAAFSLRYAW